jgi:hypothetical protein
MESVEVDEEREMGVGDIPSWREGERFHLHSGVDDLFRMIELCWLSMVKTFVLLNR